MKTYLYNTVLALIMITLLNACSDEFLNKQPTDRISSEVFFNSKTAFDQTLAANYGLMQQQPDGYSLYTFGAPLLECLSDNGYRNSSLSNSWIDIVAQGQVTSTTSNIGVIYTSMYARITRINLFLKNLADYQGEDMSSADRILYEAEVRMLRAIAYFNLYKFYGSVPLITEPLTVENQFQPKADESAIYNQIMTDVDFAISNLPTKAYKNSEGHFVKTSAQVFKARVLSFVAYNDDGSAKQDVLNQVKQLTGEVINTGYYSIKSSYRGLFCDDLNEQDNNPEYVFTVNYLGPLNPAFINASEGPFINYCTNVANGGACQPLRNFADEYEFIDGTPFSESNPLFDPEDRYKNRDPRMRLTMFTVTVTFENGFVTVSTPTPTGYDFYKVVTGSNGVDTRTTDLNSDWPFMRYAEVLLLYAEAANEVDGPTADVYNAINQIRARPGVEMPGLKVGMSKDEMRQAIRKERRIELAFEGFRYDDLKRWRIAEQKLNIPASEGISERRFEKKHYHWPLPQSEIDMAQGVLEQNPDYK
jgi:hypothetical protein